MPHRIPILTYHSIDERSAVASIAPSLFREQVAALREGGWRTARVSEIAESLREGRPFAARTLAITFDDGYRNFAEIAWPTLRDAGLGATLFALGAPRCGRNDWDAGEGSLAGEPLLDRAALRELSQDGVEVGAHSATHADLTRLAAPELEEEIDGAARALSEAIGAAVDVFAYPYGVFDERARERVATRYRAACTTRMGYVRGASDPYRLERIDTHYLRRRGGPAGVDSAWTRAALAARALPRRLRNRYG